MGCPFLSCVIQVGSGLQSLPLLGDHQVHPYPEIISYTLIPLIGHSFCTAAI